MGSLEISSIRTMGTLTMISITNSSLRRAAVGHVRTTMARNLPMTCTNSVLKHAHTYTHSFPAQFRNDVRYAASVHPRRLNILSLVVSTECNDQFLQNVSASYKTSRPEAKSDAETTGAERSEDEMGALLLPLRR